MNYAQIRKLDVSNGYGIRTTLFVSGCHYHCDNCFNIEQQDFNYGKPWTKEVEDLFISYVKNPQVIGVNLLGGEPLQQDLSVILNLVKRIKSETNKGIWLWSGDLYENIIKNPSKLEILQYIDVLIDGRFKEDLRDLALKYRGSSNQRVIDVQKSLERNEVILWE